MTTTLEKPTIAAHSSAVDPQTQHEIEQFLYREAHLLDNREWDEWEALFTDEGIYWVPLVHGQVDPFGHASLFYEDAMMRDVRRRRLEQERAWSQQPITRTARTVGNVLVTPADAGEFSVRSTFHMTEWRKGREHRSIAGHYMHELVPMAGHWRIRLKRVNLIDCDGVHDCFEVFI
jgi:benzoate/toluate 1,2-dioxygenase beta subunit